jgi:hypothetical protein
MGTGWRTSSSTNVKPKLITALINWKLLACGLVNLLPSSCYWYLQASNEYVWLCMVAIEPIFCYQHTTITKIASDKMNEMHLGLINYEVQSKFHILLFSFRIIFPPWPRYSLIQVIMPVAYQSCIEKKGFEDEIRLGLQLRITNTYTTKMILEQDIP